MGRGQFGGIYGGLTLSFNIQNIVNFVIYVSVEFSEYKNPDNNCWQMQWTARGQESHASPKLQGSGNFKA